MAMRPIATSSSRRRKSPSICASRMQRSHSQEALKSEDFAGAMAALAALRAPVDEFFDKVTVNVPGETEEARALRANRLRLLSQIRDTLNRVADFSQIEG